MYNKLLKLQNLNQRKYVHGTLIVQGVMAELVSSYGIVKNFKIRLFKPLYMLPIIHVDATSSEKPFISGSFEVDNTTIPFYLSESTEPCIQYQIIDESSLERGVKEIGDRYTVKLMPTDNIMVAWSAIERPCNFELFGRLGLRVPGKQMWFTRMELDNLDFLEHDIKSVGSSIAYNRLSEFCIQRKI